MIKKYFSFISIIQKLSLIAKRFPITILFVAGLASLFFVLINGSTEISLKLWVFCSVGAFVGMATSLCAEDFFNILKTQLAALVAVLLLGIYCFFLPAKINEINLSKGIEIGVIGASSVLSIFFISFLKSDREKSFWNFAVRTIFQLALAGLFGVIFWCGLSLAILSVQQLFGVNIDNKVYANLATVCFVLFTPLYFLANIPDKTAKHDDEIVSNKILKILSLYILTPILAVYTVILYVYLFKIIAAWELPNGWVSLLATALGFGGLLVIVLLFPLRLREENRIAVFLSRYMGLFILPLLVLMSIAIFRRIDDYGITINRCYVLLLNFWFYGIYAYLFLIKSKHIKWIIISPIIVALLSSVGFWSVANVTQKYLTAQVNNYLNHQQVTIEEAKSLFSEMEEKDRKKIKSDLEYLYNTYGAESVQPFFSQNIREYGRYSLFSKLEINSTTDKGRDFYFYSTKNKIWHIENYNIFISISYNRHSIKQPEISCSFEKETFIIKTDQDDRIFSVPMKEMIFEQLEKKNRKENYVFTSDEYTILVSEFNGKYYEKTDSIILDNFKGYLFYNR